MKSASRQNNLNKNKDKRKSKPNIIEKINKIWIHIAIIVLISIAVYIPAINFGLIHLDDDVVLIEKYEKISNSQFLKDAFKTDLYFNKTGEYYRPLMTVTFMIDSFIGGNNPTIYHSSNILLHCLVVSFLYFLFITLGLNSFISLGLAVIYAVHPINVNAVVWILARNDLLATLFFLTGFISFIYYFRINKIIFLVFHSLSFLSALLSKELALVFPLIFIIYSVYVLKNQILDKRHITLGIIWIIILIIWYILRSAVVQTSMGIDYLFGNLVKNIWTIPEIAAKFVFPAKLAPLPMFTPFNMILGSLFLISLIVLSMLNFRNRMMIFAGLFFVVLLLPGMLMISEHNFNYLECRAYLPTIGILLLVGSLIGLVQKKIRTEKILLILLILSLPLALINYSYSSAYKDRMTFYKRAAAETPNSALAYNNLGYAFRDAGKLDSAIVYLKKCLEINPNYDHTLNNIGNYLAMQGDFPTAVEYYRKAIAVRPGFEDALYNLSITYLQMNENEKCLYYFNKLDSINPENNKSLLYKGVAYNNLGQFEKAISVLIKGLNLNNPFVFSNLGVSYLNLKDYPKALDMFLKAYKLKSDEVNFSRNCGFLYGQLGNEEKQIEFYKIAARLGNVEIQNWLKSKKLNW